MDFSQVQLVAKFKKQELDNLAHYFLVWLQQIQTYHDIFLGSSTSVLSKTQSQIANGLSARLHEHRLIVTKSVILFFYEFPNSDINTNNVDYVQDCLFLFGK